MKAYQYPSNKELYAELRGMFDEASFISNAPPVIRYAMFSVFALGAAHMAKILSEDFSEPEPDEGRDAWIAAKRSVLQERLDAAFDAHGRYSDAVGKTRESLLALHTRGALAMTELTHREFLAEDKHNHNPKDTRHAPR